GVACRAARYVRTASADRDELSLDRGLLRPAPLSGVWNHGVGGRLGHHFLEASRGSPTPERARASPRPQRARSESTGADRRIATPRSAPGWSADSKADRALSARG